MLVRISIVQIRNGLVHDTLGFDARMVILPLKGVRKSHRLVHEKISCMYIAKQISQIKEISFQNKKFRLFWAYCFKGETRTGRDGPGKTTRGIKWTRDMMMH
jgi:hypothetical protein